MQRILECCVNSAVSAVEAQEGGADRVELCENMADGGTTPSAGSIRLARQSLRIGLYVMIRPRGADFLYNDLEFSIMKEDVLMARSLGADGVVFGILRADGTIDRERMEELVHLASPMGVTCHRAFDMTRDPFEAMETLIGLGVERILTSGQRENALAGAPLIRQLIEKADNRIVVMPGNGIKEHNLQEVIRETGATEFHVRLDKTVDSGMIFRNPAAKMGSPQQSEYDYVVTDRERVINMRYKL